MPPDCWKWDADPVIWHGPIDLRWYSLCFVGVFLVGWAILRWQMKRGGHKAEWAADFIIWAMAGVVIGGWLGHHFFYRFDKVLENPAILLSFTRGIRGLSSHGSTVGLILVLYLFGRKHGISMWEMIDHFSFSACIGATLVRVGNFFNSEILGRPTDLPWAVCFLRKDTPPIPRHPSQLYEALLGLVVLGLMLLVDRWAGKEKRPMKLMGGCFMAIYFAFRFVVEFFKDHQALSSSSALTMGQYLSIPFCAFGIILIVQALRSRGEPSPAAAPRKSSGKRSKKRKVKRK